MRRLIGWGLCMALLSSLQAQFALVGDAIDLGGDCYRMTPDLLSQSGSAWYPDLIDLTQDFAISVDINLGTKDFNGADGIAFVLQPISTSIGTLGGGLGYEGVSPSIAVEFDTYQNGANFDPATDHIAMLQNGVVVHSGPTSLVPPVDILATSGNAEDGQFHQVLIRWDAATTTLAVDVDCSTRLAYTGDLVTNAFSGDPAVYFGFTSSTGGLSNEQTVCFNFLDLEFPPDTLALCAGDSVLLTAPDGFFNYAWFPAADLDDPTSETPMANPAISTLYTVSFTDNCGVPYSADVFVEVTPAPAVDLGVDTVICGTASLTLTVPGSPTSLAWSDGSSGSTLTVSSTGNYWVAADYNGCIAGDTISVVSNNPDAGTMPDQDFCANASLLIGPSADPACNYQWNTGATTTPLLITEGGTYVLICEQGPCFDTDTVNITAVDPPVLSLPDSLPWCFGFPTTIEVSGSSAPYVWSTGESGSSIDVATPGVYTVSTTVGPCTAQESTSVFEVAVCDPELEMPNAFSPNGDGINDFFTAYGNFVLEYRLSIYNRWGTLIYQSVDPSQVSQMNAGWDGTYKGVPQEAGTYIYHVSASGREGATVELQGEVYLVR